MSRAALVDAAGVLLAHGYTDFARAKGQAVVPVADDFAGIPGEVRWTGIAWAPYVAPPRSEDDFAAEALARLQNDRMFAAVSVWVAQRLGVSITTARAEIATIYKRLP